MNPDSDVQRIFKPIWLIACIAVPLVIWIAGPRDRDTRMKLVVAALAILIVAGVVVLWMF